MKIVKVGGPRQNPIKLQVTSSKERSNRSNGMKMYKHIQDMKNVFRTLRTLSTITANDSGLIALAALTTTSVTSNPDWSNISQEFQRYRVRSMKLFLMPAHPTSAAHSGADDYPLGVLMLNRWWERSPSSLGNVTQAHNLVIAYSGKTKEIFTNYLGFVDAQLWTDTSGSIPAAQAYGIGYVSSNSHTLFEASTVAFNTIVEFDIEFQSPQ